MKSTLLAVFSLWTGLTVFSSRAEAACNWNLEIFKAKISDSCQAEFMGKLTDEQDRIYSRRMFKDWNLPKGTEVSVEPGFLQVSNTETGELYQVAWLSDKPLMMWIDGVVVSDASSDTSIFRRIEKLYKKAHEEAQARRDPVRTFLFGNDAYAELMGPDLPLTNLYHVNGYTGTASDFLATRDQNLKGLFGNSEWASSWLSSWTSGRSNTCVANKIDDFKTDIDGKPVTIHQVTKTEFTVTGLVPGKSVKVDMNPSATGVAVATGSGKSSKQKKKKKKNSYIATYACDGRYSVDSDSQCKDAWTDYVSKHPDIKSKFDSVLSANGGADKVNYASDVTCSKLYDKGSGRDSCVEYIHDRVPRNGHRFGEQSAHFRICETDGTGCERTLRSAAGLFKKQEDYKSTVDSKGYDEEQKAYLSYRDALSKAGVGDDTIDGLCPSTDLAQVPTCERFTGFKNLKISSANKKKIETAYQALKNPENEVATDEGNRREHEIAKRMLGVMMLSDCCVNNECQNQIKKEHGIELKHDGTAK